MKHLRIFLLLSALLSVSCSTLPGSMDPPIVDLKEIALADATLSDTVMIFRVEVENPNSKAIKVDSFGYDIRLNGKKFGDGVVGQNIRVKPNSKAEIEIPIKVDIVRLYDSVMVALHDRVADYKLTGTLKSGSFIVPITKEGTTKVIP